MYLMVVVKMKKENFFFNLEFELSNMFFLIVMIVMKCFGFLKWLL